jgi:riboflavin biosynthesis pyrimidine reductase
VKLTSIFPVQTQTEISNVEDLKDFYHATGFRFNHVVSANGPALNSDDVSSVADRLVLKAIRASSDLIVTTGKTARAEQLNASQFAPLLILTGQDSLECPATQNQSGEQVFVTCKPKEFPNANAYGVGPVTEPLHQWLLDFCSKNGFHNVVLESGIETLRELIPTGIVKEICLTVTASTSLDSSDEVAAQFLKNLGVVAQLIQLLEINQDYFYRFSLTNAAIES